MKRMEIAARVRGDKKMDKNDSAIEGNTEGNKGGAYRSILDVRETERAIVLIKDFFQMSLATELRLTRVTAPLFVEGGQGINDDLNGVERPVSFDAPSLGGKRLEIVQSLAKWKRIKCTEMALQSGYGIYTDMNAIRSDEVLDNVHSLYVDQWDWEEVIKDSERTLDVLLSAARRVYRCVRRTEFLIYDNYPAIPPSLPQEMKVIHAQELLDRWPDKTPKERERLAAKEFGSIFVVGIGGALRDGTIHDGRAPDYDDWITKTGDGRRGLNGDIIVYDDVLNTSLELSSMGIRVSPKTLHEQLVERGETKREELPFHKRLLSGGLLQTMGGGIGQSRLCMLMLKKAHIGEVHASVWPNDMKEECKKKGIVLL